MIKKKYLKIRHRIAKRRRAKRIASLRADLSQARRSKRRKVVRAGGIPVFLSLFLGASILFQNCSRPASQVTSDILDVETPGRALNAVDIHEVAIAFVHPKGDFEIEAPDNSYVEWITQNAPKNASVEVDILQNNQIVESWLGPLSYRGLETHSSIELNTSTFKSGGTFIARARLVRSDSRDILAEATSQPFVIQSHHKKISTDFAFDLKNTSFMVGNYTLLRIKTAFAPPDVKLSVIDLMRGNEKVITLLENVNPNDLLDVYIPSSVSPGDGYSLRGVLNESGSRTRVIGQALVEARSDTFSIDPPRPLLTIDFTKKNRSPMTVHRDQKIELEWKIKNFPKGAFFTYIGVQRIRPTLDPKETLLKEPIVPVAWVYQYDPEDATANFSLPESMPPGSYQFVVVIQREAAENTLGLLEIGRVASPEWLLLP